MKTYTLRISDGPDGTIWPGYDAVSIRASSISAAATRAREILAREAAGLQAADGYAVGQTITARISDSRGLSWRVDHILTASDLGEEISR